ncbi:hypothetical protein Tco_0812939 [Tanacetum coccineum]
MGGSSSQPRTDRVRSPTNAFSLGELYTPDFSDSLQENISFWQAPNPYEVPVEQVATSPMKKKGATRGLAVSENNKHGNSRNQGDLKDHPKWQEITSPNFNIGSEGGSKRHKSTGSSLFNTESEEASFNLNTTVGDNDEDGVQEIRRLEGMDKAKAAGKKNKRSKSAGSSNVNEDALARLMVTEMTAHEKEKLLSFLDIKRREVKCHEREISQQDTRFYLQPYDHLTSDRRKIMDEIRAKIKVKYNLQY